MGIEPANHAFAMASSVNKQVDRAVIRKGHEVRAVCLCNKMQVSSVHTPLACEQYVRVQHLWRFQLLASLDVSMQRLGALCRNR